MGLHKRIETAEKLWELFTEFKAWLKDNPILKAEFNAKVNEIVYIPLQRPITWARFDTWIFEKGLLENLEDYRSNRDGRYADFGGVVSRINQEMYANKFEGAAVNIFNPNIIARDLGLRDGSDVTSKGQQIQNPVVIAQSQESADEIAELLKRFK